MSSQSALHAMKDVLREKDCKKAFAIAIEPALSDDYAPAILYCYEQVLHHPVLLRDICSIHLATCLLQKLNDPCERVLSRINMQIFRNAEWSPEQLGTVYLIIGSFYRHVERNDTVALLAFQYAAHLGSVDALYNLAQSYVNEKSMPRDVKTHMLWLAAAADVGHEAAQDDLAWAILNYCKIPKLRQESTYLLRFARRNGLHI